MKITELNAEHSRVLNEATIRYNSISQKFAALPPEEQDRLTAVSRELLFQASIFLENARNESRNAPKTGEAREKDFNSLQKSYQLRTELRRTEQALDDELQSNESSDSSIGANSPSDSPTKQRSSQTSSKIFRRTLA